MTYPGNSSWSKVFLLGVEIGNIPYRFIYCICTNNKRFGIVTSGNFKRLANMLFLYFMPLMKKIVKIFLLFLHILFYAKT